MTVADGLYTGPGNKNLDFGGKEITLRSVGGPENCVIDCQGDGKGFHFHSGKTADSVVDGFAVVNGYATEHEDGGAVLCEQASSPVFSNCVFRQNMAILGAGGVGCYDSSPTFIDCTITENAEDAWEEEPSVAGGVNCIGGDPTFLNCSITDNWTNSYSGGGVRCLNGNVTFSDCTIAGNQAWEYGGGIYADGDGNLTITGCTIMKNTVGSENSFIGWGGGIACGITGNATITNCTISGNTAWGDGGGVSYSGSGNLIIADSTISENVTVSYGGGLFCDAVTPAVIVANCVIKGNTAAVGGGVHCSWGSTTIANCRITGNTAINGAGVGSQTADVTIANCTISANTAESAGGAAYCYGGDSVIANSVLWRNLAEAGKEISLDHYSPSDPMTVSVSYSDIHGGQGGVYVADGCTLNWGDGNIDADPLFADPNETDYHLLTGSPCIDAACNCAAPEDLADFDGDGDTDEYLPFDLDGEGRFFDDPNTPDAGSGLPPIVDMGAYEFGGSDLPPCRGDLDGDRDVDLADLAELLGHYGTTSGANGSDGDMDCDGDVELSDLSDLLGVYGEVCE